MLDDVGSSGWLGLQSMIATVREFDGRGAPTVLSARVLEAIEIEDVDQILHRVDSEGLTRREMGELAKLVTEAAREGDLVAQEIIATGVDELATLVATVADRLELADRLGEVPVAVTGGLSKAQGVFLDPLRAALRQRAPACRLIKPQLQPVIGAILLALESLGIALTPVVVDKLRDGQSVPG